jgi:hypothetical protein
MNLPCVRNLSVAHLAKILVVEPTHHGSSPRLGTEARIFLDLFQDLSGAIFPVVGGGSSTVRR